MNVFIQGMRRNGTTVLFDLFCEDGSFGTWYEPLARVKPNVGGGSGLRKVEYFDNVRGARRFLTERFGEQEFNWGAPGNPALEFDDDVPEHIRRYLFLLTTLDEDTVIKFTRMARKAGVLHSIDPDAFFLHVVRDPRRVAASCVFGRPGPEGAGQDARRDFFTACGRGIGWNMQAFCAPLMREAGMGSGLADFARVMLVWKDCFEHTRRARELFGPRYMLVRHEDYCADPARMVRDIYSLLGREPSERLLSWARASIRGSSDVFDPDNPAWDEAFDRLGMRPALEDCGYA